MLLLGGALAIITLLGAGCATQPQTKDAGVVKDEKKSDANKQIIQTEVQVEPTTPTTPTVTIETTETPTTNTGLTLTVETIDEPKTIKLKWVPSDDVAKDAQAYRSLLSKDPNPEYPTKGWWYENGATFREKLWTGLPTGKFHIRTCAVKDDKCVVYSNDVEVDIK